MSQPPDPLGANELWPVYERVGRVLRTAVIGATTHAEAGKQVLADELQGLVALTSTAVEILSGVGSVLVRANGQRLAMQTLNAMLGQAPAYRSAPAKAARDWMAFWVGDNHWQLMQWIEQAIAADQAADVATALVEFCDWQNGLIALLAGKSREDQFDEFLRHWREKG